MHSFEFHAPQFPTALHTLVETVERTEHIGELEGKLAELKIITDELAEDGAHKERQRVKSLVADQEKLLKLVCRPRDNLNKSP